jgi:beta-barrel assembly-enhancing protease
MAINPRRFLAIGLFSRGISMTPMNWLLLTNCLYFTGWRRFCRCVCLSLSLGAFCAARVAAQKTNAASELVHHGSSSAESNKFTVATRSQKAHRSINFYSEEKEERIGQELAEEIESDLPMVVDDSVLEYVNRLARRISEQSNSRYPITVKVFVDGDDNASALPGGYIYITTALVLKVHSEAELAGVIAHEVGHIAARHRTRKLTRERMWNWPFFAFERISPLESWVEQLPRVLSAIPSHRFNRGCEYEADSLGIAYVSRAGYDPRETLHVLERWATQEKHRSIFRRLMDDQPPLPSRVQKVRAQIGGLADPEREYVTDVTEFHEVQKHLREIL